MTHLQNLFSYQIFQLMYMEYNLISRFSLIEYGDVF